jgi:hypothetical protein
MRNEPSLAAVFEFIEEQYSEPVSLSDIAARVGLTPGHLTTVVRRKTRRTAQQWLNERRMAMAGADDEAAVDRVLPILGVVGRRVFRTGPLGSGHAMKALNNFCAAAGYAALAEALVLGRSFGLAPSTMIDVVNNSTGRSFCSDVVFPEEVVTGTLRHRLRGRPAGQGRDERGGHRTRLGHRRTIV